MSEQKKEKRKALTVRMSKSLRSEIRRKAAARNVSVNTWMCRCIMDALARLELHDNASSERDALPVPLPPASNGKGKGHG